MLYLEEKVIGRRNWVIKTKDNTATLYGWGQAKREGVLCERLVTIAKHNINWFEYTYKKDALSALDTLKEHGYKVKIFSN